MGSRARTSLPRSLSEPLLLVLRERCSYREAARRLGLPPDVVARHLRQALRELRGPVAGA